MGPGTPRLSVARHGRHHSCFHISMQSSWNHNRARVLVAVFIVLLAAGRYRAWSDRIILPDDNPGCWPPHEAVRVLDATLTPAGRFLTFPPGTTTGKALRSIDLVPDTAIEDRFMTRASVAVWGNQGWILRAMTQQERLIWRLPMDLNRVVTEDLVMIHGVGLKTAGKIYDFINERVWLPSVDKLAAVKGVGPHRLKLLDRYLEVEGEGG